MALTRREALALLSASGVLSCAGSGREAGSAYRILKKQPAPPGAATVLVCMPETPQTREVWTGLSDEVGGAFGLVALRVTSRDASHAIARAIEHHEPRALVLMNNPTVAAYREYLARTDAVRGLPAVVLMTSFLDTAELEAIGAAGISYEVPLISVVTNLRQIVATPVERVGVVYRRPLAPFMTKQRALAQREQIRVVEAVVSPSPNDSELKRALRLLKPKVDALWVLNDDRLLTPSLIARGWLPGLNEKPWRLTIVGVPSLVSAALSFGTFAVLPDHTALGAQAANLVLEIAESGWALPHPGVSEPLSTTTTIDLTQARERFTLRRGALSHVDRIVE